MTIKNIPVDDVVVSALNPRHIDQEDPEEQRKLGELQESVAVHGILENLIGRLRDDDSGKVEILVGQRRLIVARRLSMATVPVDVRDMDDVTARAVAQTEQLQRSDLKPLDEAESFRDQRAAGQTEQQIAESIGKPPSYVRRRLALLGLAPKVSRALEAGKIGIDVAGLLADVSSSKAQEELLAKTIEAVEQTDFDGIRPTALRDMILRDYTYCLEEAPFDTNDPTLVPKAGPCWECPKSTGVQPDLLALGTSRVNTAAHCTDRDCWGGKVNAHLSVLQKRDGRTVLSAEQAARILDPFGNVKPASGWVDLDAPCHAVTSASSAAGKPWRKAIGKKHMPEPGAIALVKTASGAIREVVRERDAKAAIAKAHPEQAATVPSKAKSNGKNGDATKSAKDREMERACEEMTERLPMAVLAKVLIKMVQSSDAKAMGSTIRVLAEIAAAQHGGEIPPDIGAVFGVIAWEKVTDYVDKVDSDRVALAALVAAIMVPVLEEDGVLSSRLKALCKHYGVKPAEIEKKLKLETAQALADRG